VYVPVLLLLLLLLLLLPLQFGESPSIHVLNAQRWLASLGMS
jgi:hypothetical protein